MVDFTKLLDKEYKWPQDGDLLFTTSKEIGSNANINIHRHGRLVMMITGYKRGADLLVAEAATSPISRDTLVYPIIFSYRQFIELALKYLIATYGKAVGVNENWTSHDILHLWAEFKKLLEGYGGTEADNSDRAVASMVKEFSEIDKNSFTFRYPADKDGKLVPIELDELDLTSLSITMDGISHYFDGCDGILNNLQDAFSEPY